MFKNQLLGHVAGSISRMTVDLRVKSSSPMLGIEITLKVNTFIYTKASKPINQSTLLLMAHSMIPFIQSSRIGKINNNIKNRNRSIGMW